MPGGIREVHPATAVVVVDLARPIVTGVRPMLQAARLDLAVDRVELLLGDEEGVVLPRDFLALGASAKSRLTPCSSATTMKRPNGFGLGRPNSSARNSADSFLSREATMVWLKLMVIVLSSQPLLARGDNARSATWAYLGAVCSRAMLSGSRNSRMYDGPM